MSNFGVPFAENQNSSSTFEKTYNSFSGADMQLTFGGQVIGEVQGMSYTIQREKAPIYTMGSADPRSFSRGKRGIAGSLVFQILDRSPLLEAFRDVPYIANKYDIQQGFTITDVEIPVIELASGLIGTTDGSARPSISRITLDKVLARPMYVDQVLPFDVVVTAGNEYGAFAKMVIHGVEILNSGSGMSIDDISLDEACTFVATRVTPWQNQGFVRVGKGGQVSDISA